MFPNYRSRTRQFVCVLPSKRKCTTVQQTAFDDHSDEDITLAEDESLPITELDNAESIDDTDQSISDDSDVEAEGTELNPPVEPQKLEGKAIGKTVFTDNALAKRSAKWKKKLFHLRLTLSTSLIVIKT